MTVLKKQQRGRRLSIRTILLAIVAGSIVLVSLINLRLSSVNNYSNSPASGGVLLNHYESLADNTATIGHHQDEKTDVVQTGQLLLQPPLLLLDDAADADGAAKSQEQDERKDVMPPVLDDYYNDANYSMFSIPVQEWRPTSASSSAAQPHYYYKVNVKAYVYDTLPNHLTTSVETCLLDTYTNTIDHVENFKAELGLIYLFQTYPGRTYNPHEADIFVVPYAAEGHCQCAEGYSYNCAQVSNTDMDALRASLLYLNETTKKRHLFVLAGARAKPPLWSKPFQLTTAPALPDIKPGRIVIPNLEDKAPYQPSALLLNRNTEWWTTRPRKYSFSFIYGGRNAKMNAGGRIYRDYLEAAIGNTTTAIGSHAFYMKRWKSPHDFHKLETFSYYNESIFCPCLPGDLAWQKRFFDAILNGCLPVVLSFPVVLQDGITSSKSWFLPKGGETVQQTYPFAKGAFGNATNTWEIDYESFVVEIPMTADRTNLTHMLPIMEALLLSPTLLRQRQLAMKQAALAFTYGMGHDAHRYKDDAFGRILQAIRHYLDHRLVIVKKY